MHNTERKNTFRLNRVFNLLNPHVYKNSLFVGAILLIWGIYQLVTNKSFSGVYIAVAVLILVLNGMSIVLHCPKNISIEDNLIQFDDYVNMRPRHIRVSGFCWLQVHYSVSQIKNLEFHQNSIERLFDVGHISFSGKATFTAKRDVDRINEKDTFVIYGIKDFSCFKQTIMEK